LHLIKFDAFPFVFIKTEFYKWIRTYSAILLLVEVKMVNEKKSIQITHKCISIFKVLETNVFMIVYK